MQNFDLWGTPYTNRDGSRHKVTVIDAGSKHVQPDIARMQHVVTNLVNTSRDPPGRPRRIPYARLETSLYASKTGGVDLWRATSSRFVPVDSKMIRVNEIPDAGSATVPNTFGSATSRGSDCSLTFTVSINQDFDTRDNLLALMPSTPAQPDLT